MRLSSLQGAQAPANLYETGKLPAGIILGGRYLLLHKIAQGGRVAIENDVELQANACIDRASVGETRVRRGAARAIDTAA